MKLAIYLGKTHNKGKSSIKLNQIPEYDNYWTSLLEKGTVDWSFHQSPGAKNHGLEAHAHLLNTLFTPKHCKLATNVVRELEVYLRWLTPDICFIYYAKKTRCDIENRNSFSDWQKAINVAPHDTPLPAMNNCSQDHHHETLLEQAGNQYSISGNASLP